MFYVDDGIFFAKNDKDVNKPKKVLINVKKAKCKLNLEDQGDVKDYLGIHFKKLQDGRIKLS